MSENGAGRRTSSGVRSKGSLRFLAFTFPFGESPPFFGGITSEHEPIHGVSNRGQVTIHVVVGPSVCANPRARGIIGFPASGCKARAGAGEASRKAEPVVRACKRRPEGGAPRVYFLPITTQASCLSKSGPLFHH